MDIAINGKGIDLGSSLRAHINEKLESIVCKHFPEAIEAIVQISMDNHNITADITVHISKGISLRSHQSAMDAYVSFDLALHKIDTRLRRYHNKIKKHHEKQPTASTIRAMNYVLAHSHGEVEELPGNDSVANGAIIAEMAEEIPTLSVSDAVMKMDLADHNVFVFKNIQHGGLNIVHRRTDGNIGWIDPQVSKDVHTL
jgi:ribosomal subunit interface protein